MAPSHKAQERALEEAVSRVLRDNLAAVQRTAEELHEACADLNSACSSSRPTNALPPMLRAQTAAASLAARLDILSNFVSGAFQPRERPAAETELLRAVDSEAAARAALEYAEQIAETVEQLPRLPEIPLRVPPPVEEEPSETAFAAPPVEAPQETREAETPVAEAARTDWPAVEEPGRPTVTPPAVMEEVLPETLPAAPEAIDSPAMLAALRAAGIEEPAVEEALLADPVIEEPLVEDTVVFDVGRLPRSEQELHRRANRLAKVAMQDIQLLRPEQVRQGRDRKDLCVRLRGDLDKARKEYDRRFKAILDHPVDYFHYWLVAILAAGDAEVLGEYPYPSPVLRH